MSDIRNNQSFTNKIKTQHANWNLYEKLLFGINLLVCVVLLIYSAINNASDWTIWVAFVGNIFNILSVILATKKRVICFFWGILAVVAFGAIAYDTQLFGNMILYWAFYVPAQIVAWILWYRASDNKIEIKPVKMKWWQILIAICSIIAFAALFSYVETIDKFQEVWFGKGFNKDGDHLLIRYIFDATILVSSIALTFFAWLRFRERWVLSIFIDTIQTIMWILIASGSDFKHRPNGFSFNNSGWIMAVSSLTMLIAAIYGVYNWYKQDKGNK